MKKENFIYNKKTKCYETKLDAMQLRIMGDMSDEKLLYLDELLCGYPIQYLKIVTMLKQNEMFQMHYQNLSEREIMHGFRHVCLSIADDKGILSYHTHEFAKYPIVISFTQQFQLSDIQI
ncbi:MAG: hypothetical protein ACK5KR_00465 [Breznakia sp.]